MAVGLPGRDRVVWLVREARKYLPDTSKSADVVDFVLADFLANPDPDWDGTWVRIESRRGVVTLRAEVVKTIRPDTVFVPYHWPGPKSINQVTIAAQDPISKIPEYKVCAVRVIKAPAPPEYASQREAQQ